MTGNLKSFPQRPDPSNPLCCGSDALMPGHNENLMINGLGNDDGTSENNDLDDVDQHVWTILASKLTCFSGE